VEGGVAGEEAGGEWRGPKEKARSRRHGGQTHTSWHFGGGPCLGGLIRTLESGAEERAKVGGPVQPPPWRPDTDELAFGGGEGQRPLQLGMQGWREMQERAKEENGF
jgi:hypothetical protein